VKLLNIEVHNILRVKDANLDTSGHHLFLVGGRNGDGKSSVLKAVACALCGKRDMGDEWPDILLQEGKGEGWVRLSLSGDDELHEPDGITVELFLRRKRGGVVAEEFRVLDSTGEEAPEPRTLLKRLYAFRAFDPLDFERAKPKDRAELLRKLVGLDFSELEAERSELYAERTDVNKQGKAMKAQLDAIEYPEGTPDHHLSVQELFTELQDAQEHNEQCDKHEAKLASAKNREAKLAEEEQKLKARLIEIDKERQALDGEIEKGEAVLATCKRVDLDPIREKIQTADAVNMAVEKKLRHAALSDEVEVLRAESLRLSNKIKAIDQEKQSRLESAKWPLPGLSLDDSGVLLNGLPFEQASKAQRVLASVKVGMALNPKLRLLVCQDGNDLDPQTMDMLDKILSQNDFQLLLEYVTRDSEDEAKCAVVMREGEPVRPADLVGDTVSA
jgi:hypothetical protein